MLQNHRIAATWIALLVAATFCTAVQAAPIDGTVVDREGRPLAYVSVITDQPGLGTMTDSTGRYHFDPRGRATRVTFSIVGYQPRQYSIENLPDPIVLEQTFLKGEGINVRADRAVRGLSPIAFENVTSKEIKEELTATEFPLLLESTPNLLAYTDGGASLGYSYFKIRGFDDQRIATYINGVPLNDPEDHFTYFVDIPDFGANVSDVQVQRGVGNSLYGDPSFGGTVNIVSTLFDKQRQVRLLTGYGEFTHDGEFVGRQITKQSVEYASGLVDGRWAFYGRFSKQKSSGYRNQAWYHGWSYYLSAGRLDANMMTELHLYGGPINSHLAYRGLTKEEIAVNRYAAYEGQRYANATDNFNQPHYQLHNTYFLNDKVTLRNSIYYVRGKGFYEQRRLDATYADYNLTGLSDSSSGDVVRRQWVFKNQIGWNPRVDIAFANGIHSVGGSVYYFDSNHWGEVISADYLKGLIDPTHRYYEYDGEKVVASLFGQEQRSFYDKRLTLTATLQMRYSDYKFDQTRMGAFKGYHYELDYFFLSPRIGLSYRYRPELNFYTSFGISSRAPNDYNIYDASDPEKFPQLDITSIDTTTIPGDTLYTFGDAQVKPERVYDWELGGEYAAERFCFGINLFLMRYDNENIFEGDYDQQGRPITINLERSTHAGIELSGSAAPIDSLTLSGNFSYNHNRIDRFEAYGFDFADKTVPGFPDYIGSITAGYRYGRGDFRVQSRFIGKQQIDPANSEALIIDPVVTASASLDYDIVNALSLGTIQLSVHVDNLFDKKYIASGYGGNWNDGTSVPASWAEYFVAPERSFYGQVSLEMF